MKVPSGIRLRRLRVPGIAPLKVYLVDGERVRDEIEIDYTMGGTHGRFKFIPKNEVWIEQILSPHDRVATLAHELRELGLMRHGMTYLKAHEQANTVERAVRKIDRRRRRRR